MIPCGLQGAGKGAVEEHHARGYMLRKRGDFDSAILHYGKALEAQSKPLQRSLQSRLLL